jgi:hypothetical protein
MRDEVLERRRMIETRFHKAPRMNLEVEFGPYTQELKQAQLFRSDRGKPRAA